MKTYRLRLTRVAFVRLVTLGAALGMLTGCGYNRLQALDEDAMGAWAQVENQYQRRADLIPNIVETVKAYAAHEKETLEAVIAARSQATKIQTSPGITSDPEAFRRFQQAQDGLGSALSRLMVVVERYPDLKANQNYLALQAQLEGTENRISVARRDYIEAVKRYNTKVRSFPTNLTAKYLLGLERRETFTAVPGAEKAPKVSF